MKHADKIELIEIEKLIPYARNSRTHSEEQVAQIAGSIREFGFTNPVLVDKDGTIVAGHGRVMAARKLGMASVPCLRLGHLTESQVRAYVIADNKLALNAGWDEEMLKSEIAAIKDDGFDIDLLGFSDDELSELLQPEIVQGQTDPDQVPEVPEEPVTKPGDLWLLGDHRLLCGDSTKKEDLQRLMAGKTADMVFTDPPYGVGYTPKASASDGNSVSSKRKAMAGLLIANDADPEQALQVTKDALFLHASVQSMFICCDWKSYPTMLDVSRQIDRQPKACIIWDKGGPYQHLDRFAKRHEFIIYSGPFGGEKTFDTDIWRFPREFRHDHPTPKPVELVDHAIQSSSKLGDVVVDVFGGSGSTLIACEKTGRQARLMELDPRYCDVIVKRWEDFTGKKAVLESANAE